MVVATSSEKQTRKNSRDGESPRKSKAVNPVNLVSPRKSMNVDRADSPAPYRSPDQSPGVLSPASTGSPESNMAGADTTVSDLSSVEERSQHIWMSTENSHDDNSPASSVFSSPKSSPNTVLNSPGRHREYLASHEHTSADVSPCSEYSLGLRVRANQREHLLHSNSIDGDEILHSGAGDEDDWILSVEMDGPDPHLRMDSPTSARESVSSLKRTPKKSREKEQIPSNGVSPRKYESSSSSRTRPPSSGSSSRYGTAASTPEEREDTSIEAPLASPEQSLTPLSHVERQDMEDNSFLHGNCSLEVMKEWRKANGLDRNSPLCTPVPNGNNGDEKTHFFVNASPPQEDSSPEHNADSQVSSPPRFSRNSSGRQAYRNKDSHPAEVEKASQERLQQRVRSSRRSSDILTDKEAKITAPIEQVRAPIFEAHHYITALKKYLDPDKKVKTLSKMSAKSTDNPNHLSTTLKKLKLDLKMSYDSFLEEFMNSPNNGLTLLVQLLKDLHADQQQKATPGGRRSKHEQHKRTLTDEYDTLVCIKFIAEREFGMQNLINQSTSLDTVAQCLISSHSKTRIVALEVLTQCCANQAGYQRVLDAMTLLRIKNGESVRFKVLVGMLQTQGTSFVHFQGSCVRFFNTLLRNESNMNAKLYLQHELLMAGFEVDQLEQLAYGIGDEYDELQRELLVWKENYIDVQNLQSDINDLEGRNFLLRQEVDLLQGRLKASEKEKRALDRQVAELNERCDAYQERIASLQDTVQSLTDLYKENTGKEAQNEVQDLDTVLRPYDDEDTSSDPSVDKYATIRSTASVASFDPPPPPPIFDSLPSSPGRKVVVPKVVLPMFNWTPINEVKNTVFLNSEPDEFYSKIDLSDFEKKFELKVKMESKASRERRERALRRLQTQIRFIETSRARNMIITKRRIGLAVDQIEDAVNQCDVSRIHGEYAELLLKYMPTKDELRLLAQHANDYTELSEAERFLFHLAQIDRLESKLSVMSFMGIFDDLTKSLIPQLDAIYRASLSITGNHRMKKIFEIILALGNYMNGGRRGYSYGFKLDSLYKLSEIKSNDRSTSILHYMVDLIEQRYPDLVGWYEELDIEIGRAASLQGLLADVHTLRRGLALVRTEKDKLDNPDNLLAFHKKATVDVPRIAELHKRMEDAYRDSCSKYGENYKTIEPDAFFKIFHDFVMNYKSSEEDLARRRFADAIPNYTSAEVDGSPRMPRNRAISRKSSSFLRKKGVDESPRREQNMRALNANLGNHNGPDKENDDPYYQAMRKPSFLQYEDPGQARSNVIAKMVENHFLRKSTENLAADDSNSDCVSRTSVQLETKQDDSTPNKIRQIKHSDSFSDKKSVGWTDSPSSKSSARGQAGRQTPPPDYSVTPRRWDDEVPSHITEEDIDNYYAAAINGENELPQDVVTFL